jgi:superfamily II DNA or RNA helicase
VFAVDVAHAHAVTASLNARRAGCARAVWGSSSTRADDLAAHARGKFQFLVNVMVLTEGWDAPYVSCVAMARPTQSRVLYAQACGRGLRLHPGKGDCLVLDFVGASCQHDLIGPEDALGGALVEMTAYRAKAPAPAPLAVPDYVPAPGWRARFAATAVRLLRRAQRAIGRLFDLVD